MLFLTDDVLAFANDAFKMEESIFVENYPGWL